MISTYSAVVGFATQVQTLKTVGCKQKQLSFPVISQMSYEMRLLVLNGLYKWPADCAQSDIIYSTQSLFDMAEINSFFRISPSRFRPEVRRQWMVNYFLCNKTIHSFYSVWPAIWQRVVYCMLKSGIFDLTYEDESVDSWLLICPELWSLIQLVKLMDTLQHHLLLFLLDGEDPLPQHKTIIYTRTALMNIRMFIRLIYKGTITSL